MVVDRVDELQENLEKDMRICVNTFQININKIFVGRVSPGMLSNIKVQYYGSMVPLYKLVNITVENFRTLVLTVFDIKTIKLIEKAIIGSELGIMPICCDNIIRIILPILTEERRLFLIKMARTEAEKNRISIRSMRHVANDKIKFLLRKKIISKDEEHYFQGEIQKLTNIFVKKINFILMKKESELMEF